MPGLICEPCCHRVGVDSRQVEAGARRGGRHEGAAGGLGAVASQALGLVVRGTHLIQVRGLPAERVQLVLGRGRNLVPLAQQREGGRVRQRVSSSHLALLYSSGSTPDGLEGFATRPPIGI